MRAISATVGPLATASGTNICLSQTPAGAIALTLNGAAVVSGAAVLDTARRVVITSAANETGRTFTITGTSYNNRVQSETVTGANIGAAQSALDYKTVTSITISGAASGAITVGTNTVASTRWLRLDEWAHAQVSIQCDVTGTATYTVQQTLDDPNDPTNPVALSAVNWVDHADTQLVNATATKQGNYGYVPLYARVTLASGTGSVTLTLVQAGSVAK
jgi:hypothetical protein